MNPAVRYASVMPASLLLLRGRGVVAALRLDHGIDRAAVGLHIRLILVVLVDHRVDHRARLVLRRLVLLALALDLGANLRILDDEAERAVVLEPIDRADIELTRAPLDHAAVDRARAV